MKSHVLTVILISFVVCAQAAPLKPQKIEKSIGRSGTVSGDEFKVSIPHTELNVTLDGFHIVPSMGLTSWVAFTAHGKGAMAMGDLVLLEDEIGPVQKEAIKNGLSVTAIHNHFLRDTPKVMFMHIGGMGSEEEVASAVKKVLDKAREVRAAKKNIGTPPAVTSSLDPKKIESVIGHAGNMAGGVYKVVIGRPDIQLLDMGSPVSSFMGFNTWMAFQGSDERAAVAGDFAMREAEVQAVIGELVGHGIEVTAIHNHMVTETPRIVFLHFWGVGKAEDLAKGLRAALDKTGNSEKTKP